MPARLAAVPDTEGEVIWLLGRLEEVLLHLAPVDADDEPPPLAVGAAALEAVQNIGGAVAAAERRPTVQLFAPGGTFELVPLLFVDLDAADLAVVGAAVAALGAALSAGHELIVDVLGCFADDPTAPEQLVAGFARTHGLLDLAADADTWALAGRLAGEGRPVVLNSAQQAAYERLTERAIALFHLNDPLARFLYRGT